jgi:N-acetylneuraminic acid mutarotase
MLAQRGLVFAQTPGPSWVFTGNLNEPRLEHTATLLTSGKVLVAGGVTNGITKTAELYDPTIGVWTLTGNLTSRRVRHTATLLPNGKVLVVGGFTRAPGPVGTPPIAATNTSELYDPTTGTWSPTGNMNSRRAWHTATRLHNGKVLVTGGLIEAGYVAYTSVLNTAELYDPESGTWSMTSSLNTGRGHVAHTATLLQDGKVLVAGGSDQIYDPFTSDEEIGGASMRSELYDPDTGSWSVTANLNTGRILHTATLLLNGQVLVSGGGGSDLGVLLDMPDTAELFNPTTGTWSFAGRISPRIVHTATLLPDGRVLVTGGEIFQETLGSSEVYNPANHNWTSTSILNEARGFHTATLLSNGRVLVTGGFQGCCNSLLSAELYEPGAYAAPNPTDDAQLFVRQQYIDFLNREPDPDGFTFWTNQILQCGSDQQFIEESRINVSAAFFLSIEFQNTGYLIERIYKAAYGDAIAVSTVAGTHQLPVPVIRFDEFLADTREIGQGIVVLQHGWEEVLENNKQAFTQEFVLRPRFATAFPQSMSATQFVDALNTNAGLPLSQSERDSLVSELLSGAKTRAQILRAVAEDLASVEFNRAFVLMQYFGYLRRNPNNAPDSDYSGYDFWLTKLNLFNGNFQQAEMVKAFLASDEYRGRLGP